jgi:oxygen-independent coproporphyrinogen-3 oxidase
VFNFAYVPWLKPHQRVIPKDALPDPDTKLALLKLAIETLSKMGYVYIGMDHFAKPNDELAIAQREGLLHRNFQGYSTKAHADLYALGVSSISQFDHVYAQNEKKIAEYESLVLKGQIPTRCGYALSRDDEIRRFTIMRLMCSMELDKKDVEMRFGIDFDVYFQESLKSLEPFRKEGLVELSEERIVVKPLGRLIIRSIVMGFDAYLERLLKEKPVFSRTV